MLTVDVCRKECGIHLLTLAGEFDLCEKEKVFSSLLSVITDGSRGLVVDLSAITLLTSTAIKTLCIYQRMLQAAGIPMAIAAHPDNYPVALFRSIGAFEGSNLAFFETASDAESGIAGSESALLFST